MRSTAGRYRSKSEEVRVIAEGMKDAIARSVLMDIAKDYDQLAQWFEGEDPSTPMPLAGHD
jgi:hypothetical protein